MGTHSYRGSGASDSPAFYRLSVGSEVKVAYLRTREDLSCACDPGTPLGGLGSVDVLSVVMLVLIPAGFASVLAFGFEQFRRAGRLYLASR